MFWDKEIFWTCAIGAIISIAALHVFAHYSGSYVAMGVL